MFAPLRPNPLDINALTFEEIVTLSQQSFNDTTPGPILRDFRTLLDHLEEGIPITARAQLPTLKFLGEFNEILSRPTRLKLKRANQKHYVYAIGLFWIARTMGFACPKPRKKNSLIAEPEYLERWAKLKPEEQYFSLLSAWLHQADHDFLGDRGPFPIQRCLELFDRLRKKGTPLQVTGCDPRNEKQHLSFQPSLVNLALLDGFGLIHAEAVEPKPGLAWSIRSIALTDFGAALLSALENMYPPESRMPFHFFPFDILHGDLESSEEPPESPPSSIPFAPDSNEYQMLEKLTQLMERNVMGAASQEEVGRELKAMFDENPGGKETMMSLMAKAVEESEAEAAKLRGLMARGTQPESTADFDLYYDSFCKFVPGLTNTLKLDIPEFQEGVFILKVSLGKAWRRLAIPCMWTLDGVANIILEAFEFEDMAHLYAFNFANGVGMPLSIVHEYADFGIAIASEVRLGDLPIVPGSRIDFNFDFGDDWHFDILLESIDELDEQTRLDPNAFQIGSQGDPPPQYPDYDEDW